MENTATIGSILKVERERRGLSLDEVHDATKITAHNLSALEDDRFDYFPNRVYARAFLRDYANYLGLDSGALLTRYEDNWGSAQEIKAVPQPSRRSPWKAVGYAFLLLVVLAGVGVAAYFYRMASEERRNIAKAPSEVPATPDKREVATLPKVEPIIPKKPEGTPKSEQPKPEQPPAPERLVLQVSALVPDWVRVTVDGKKDYEGVMQKGETRAWEAKKSIKIRVGQPAGVQIKLNGVTQPIIGDPRLAATKEYTLPELRPVPVAPDANAAPAAPPSNPVSP
ncbi:MAG: DUF4115 domain-containing protein [Armatimonadetes bacterium]|nr:DUF4115 domain-containing protein [Armatimonadota bacterium]